MRRRMVDHAVATYGRLDCLYNNAGVMPEADHSVVDTDVATWDAVMAVNVRGRLPGLQVRDPGDDRRPAAARSSTSRASWRSSAAACPQDAYTASKGAVLSLTRSLAVQFGPNGIRTNAICPGPVETPMLMDWLLKDEAAKKLRLARNPTGRFGKPEEIVQMASTSPRTSRAGPTARRSSSTAASPSTTSEGRDRHDGGQRRGGKRSDRHRHRRGRQRDQGGRRRHRGGAVRLRAAARGDAQSRRRRMPSSPRSAGIVRRLAKASGLGPTTPVGVGLPGVTLDEHAQVRRQHRSGLDRLPGRRAAAQGDRPPGQHRQRRRRGRDRRDAVWRREGPGRASSSS